jgi:hypothetical protein
MRKLALVVVITGACGGRLEPLPSAEASPRAPDRETTSAGADADEGLGDGSWATWQLIAIDRDGVRVDHPPFVELDLHPTGEAFMWTCLAAPTGDGTRCPYYARQQCLAGRVRPSGSVWLLELSDAEGARTLAEGTIVEEPSGDIFVDGRGALPARGHYRRVAYASPDTCEP